MSAKHPNTKAKKANPAPPAIQLQVAWSPKPDINVHELALCLPLLVGRVPLTNDVWESLTPAHRHFKVISQPASSK